MITVLNNPNIAKSFRLGEFTCHCGCNSMIYEPEMFEKLQAVRNIVGPLTIAVGYRCKKHNTKVGGDPNSRHMQGLAADLKSNKTVYELARACYAAGLNGIGISDNKNTSGDYYVHAQIGAAESFWTYDKNNKSHSIAKAEFLKLIGIGPSFTHEVIGTTHVVRMNPMDLKAEIVNKATKSITNRKNLANCNFFSGSKVIGWLISEGKVLAERHEYKTWKGNPKGTLIVYKDGRVEAGWRLDSEIAPKVNDIWFCVQGFNLFPEGLTVKEGVAREGFTWNEVAYETNRISIGYDSKQIVIAVRPKSDGERAAETMKNLGCNGTAIGLDSGGSCNLRVDGKEHFQTTRVLPAILFW